MSRMPYAESFIGPMREELTRLDEQTSQSKKTLAESEVAKRLECMELPPALKDF